MHARSHPEATRSRWNGIKAEQPSEHLALSASPRAAHGYNTARARAERYINASETKRAASGARADVNSAALSDAAETPPRAGLPPAAPRRAATRARPARAAPIHAALVDGSAFRVVGGAPSERLSERAAAAATPPRAGLDATMNPSAGGDYRTYAGGAGYNTMGECNSKIVAAQRGTPVSSCAPREAGVLLKIPPKFRRR